jgi:hypothetical protein
MKEPDDDRTTPSAEDLLPEYEFDYRNSKPNRFAHHSEGHKVSTSPTATETRGADKA